MPIIKKIRKARAADMEQIYLMGKDAWGQNETLEQYLTECRTSVKYEKGTWYVLESPEGLLSSCIIYKLNPNTLGIGSVATGMAYRNAGNAKLMLRQILALYKGRLFYLFSDIDPAFYQSIGFSRAPKRFQAYKETCLMYYPQNSDLTKQLIPQYF